MGKSKNSVPRRSTLLRLPMPVYERLLRRAGERQSRERRPISINSLIIEAIEQSLTKVA